MAHLKSKSEFNLDAAKVLIDEHSYYAPSVHCSYYGCFQHIKSKLNQLGFTYEKMTADITSSRQEGVRTLHSHSYPIKLILDHIQKKSDIFYKKNVSDKIKELKAFREESDYHNIDIDYTKSNNALKLSQEIIDLINTKI